jgi:hypothetical protein
MKRYFVRLIYPNGNILNSKYFTCSYEDAFKIQKNFKDVFEFEVNKPKSVKLYDDSGFLHAEIIISD